MKITPPVRAERNPVKSRAGRKAARMSPWAGFRLRGSQTDGIRKPPEPVK